MPRIMVIDDDVAVRAFLCKVLEREGYTVIEEPDGKSALRHFAGDPTDLVISDVYMPDMDGIDFLIRAQEAFPGVRIFLISGGGQMGKESVLAAASKLGAARVFEKPFKVEEILEAVRAVFSR